jgi:single-stranded-DNA-specific exonuclease
MHRPWYFRQPDHAVLRRLEAGGINSILARILAGRGIRSPEEAVRFLEPKLSYLQDPTELSGCSRAAQAIFEAVRAGKRIAVYGDYDVDGITATAILCRCIQMLGGFAHPYVPSRIDEGYGLNQSAIDSLIEAGTELLVTVDCGIASAAEVEYARRQGIPVIVTDHHCLPDQLPPADIIVHPLLGRESEHVTPLSGAGVAFKVAWQICRLAAASERLPAEFREFLLHATGLAAIGTIADVIPLEADNRVLVYCGLYALSRQPYLGIQALLEVAGVGEIQPRDSEKIAFQVAPRLNAAGRLRHANLAVELLLTNSPARARELAEELQSLNRHRQVMEAALLEECLARFHQEGWETAPALILEGEGWHPGIIGIVAGRLAERLHRPVVLIARDPERVRPAVGSARGGAGFDVFAAVSACCDLLRTFGGHPGAAGFTLWEDEIPKFRERLLEEFVRAASRAPEPEPLWIEAEVPLAALRGELVAELEKIGPFGHGNPRPVLAAARVQVSGPPAICGAAGQHLQLRLAQNGFQIRAVAFKKGHWLDELSTIDRPIDIAFHPVLDCYAGERRVQLQLVDWQTSSTEA